jgi:hypothetical protein
MTMSVELYRFKFDPTVPLEEAEMALQLALVAAEGLFGEARVRVDGGYFVDEPRRTISVDAATAVGQSVVSIYGGFLLREFGNEAFAVTRGQRRSDAASPAEAASSVSDRFGASREAVAAVA